MAVALKFLAFLVHPRCRLLVVRLDPPVKLPGKAPDGLALPKIRGPQSAASQASEVPAWLKKKDFSPHLGSLDC